MKKNEFRSNRSFKQGYRSCVWESIFHEQRVKFAELNASGQSLTNVAAVKGKIAFSDLVCAHICQHAWITCIVVIGRHQSLFNLDFRLMTEGKTWKISNMTSLKSVPCGLVDHGRVVHALIDSKDFTSNIFHLLPSCYSVAFLMKCIVIT